jgi:hypothetical protein
MMVMVAVVDSDCDGEEEKEKKNRRHLHYFICFYRAVLDEGKKGYKSWKKMTEKKKVTKYRIEVVDSPVGVTRSLSI